MRPCIIAPGIMATLSRSGVNAVTQSLILQGHRAPRASSRLSSSQSDFRHSDELAKERYDLRAGEDLTRKRARLLYQSRKRGMLENGVILSSFADKFLGQFNAQELDEYDRLINLPTNDWDIYYWATKTKPTPQEYENNVMQKLREHLKSKVSRSKQLSSSKPIANEDSNTTQTRSLFDGKDPNEILFAPTKTPDLNVDISNVDTTNYKRELFSDREIRLPGRQSMVEMTDWRKSYYEYRLRRSLSSPVSLRNMSDSKPAESYTQRINDAERNLATSQLTGDICVDKKVDRNLKHHNFLQHLLGSPFTLDPLEYDQEAAAWAEMIWHRNYGSADSTIAPKSFSCLDCKSVLQCCDYSSCGYVPKEIFAALTSESDPKTICQRCNFERNYKTSLDVDLSVGNYQSMLEFLREKPRSLICYLVDLTDFPVSIHENIVELVGLQHYFIVVGNKLDLLPQDGPHMIDRVKEALRDNLSKMRPRSPDRNIDDVVVISARTGFNLNSLVSRVLNFSEDPIDVYLVGASNTGKSTLFNALLQSELSAVQTGDLLGRASTYDVPYSNPSTKMLRFPIDMPDDYEKVLKKRRTERAERNTSLQERSLLSNTKYRQATMPHMSMLINRVEYPALNSTELVLDADEPNNQDQEPRFVDDHPMAKVVTQQREPLSADEREFDLNGYLYNVPSSSTGDQIHNLLTLEERLEVFPSETIIPRKYSVRPLQSIFVAGLARLDIMTCTSSIIIVVFASKYLPIHIVPTRKADQFYNNFLGTPLLGIPFAADKRDPTVGVWPGLQCGEETYHLKGTIWREGIADIVMSSIGWAMIRVKPDQECILQAYTPQAKGIYCRRPALLPYASASVEGKKIRDTPLFDSPHYRVRKQIKLD